MADSARPLTMVVLTLDGASVGECSKARRGAVARDLPGFTCASTWRAAGRTIPPPPTTPMPTSRAPTSSSAHMLFLEDHFLPVIAALRDRRGRVSR